MAQVKDWAKCVCVFVCVRMRIRPCFSLPHSQDLAQCVNEVKRDNETLRQITNFQLSIENLVRNRVGQGCGHMGRGLVLFLVVIC